MIPFEQFFFDEVRKENVFLRGLGYEERSEASEWGIEVEYTNDAISVRYTFGDKDLLFNTCIKLGENREYGLWEWADALGTRAAKKITDNLVPDENALGQLIQSSALCLKLNLKQILEADSKTIKKIETAREAVRLEWESKYK